MTRRPRGTAHFITGTRVEGWDGEEERKERKIFPKKQRSPKHSYAAGVCCCLVVSQGCITDEGGAWGRATSQ